MAELLADLNVTGFDSTLIDGAIENYWLLQAGRAKPFPFHAQVNGSGAGVAVQCVIPVQPGTYIAVFSFSPDETDGFFAAVRIAHDDEWHILERGVLPPPWIDPYNAAPEFFTREVIRVTQRLGAIIAYAKDKLEERLNELLENQIAELDQHWYEQ